MAYAARSIRPGRPARALRSRHRHVATVRSMIGQPAVAADPAWAGSLRRFARLAVWALPPAAAALALLSLGESAATWPYAVGAAGAWLGLVGLVALVALLAGTRGRGWATGGLLAGLGAAVLAFPGDSLGASARPTLGWAAAVLAALALGIAVLRSGVLNRADGVLLLVSAPLIGAGVTVAGFLLTIGALLLLAAALGLAWTATRTVPA